MCLSQVPEGLCFLGLARARARAGLFWGPRPRTLTAQIPDPSSPRLRFNLSSSRNWSTPALRPSLKRRRLRRPSPHHRIIRRLSPEAYSADSPTWDGGGLSPVMTRTVFLRRRQASPRQFPRDNHVLSGETRSGDLADASRKGGSWRSALGRNCRLPKSSCLAPSRRSLLPDPPLGAPWLHTPAVIAEFEQEVLYQRGLAQVGFGVHISSLVVSLLSKRLTVCLTWFDLVQCQK